MNALDSYQGLNEDARGARTDVEAGHLEAITRHLKASRLLATHAIAPDLLSDLDGHHVAAGDFPATRG